MGFYTDTQVIEILNRILTQIPTNDNKFIGVRKFVELEKNRVESLCK